MIVQQTYDLLRSRYGKQLAELTISDARIGLYLTAVRLSDGSVGTSAVVSDGRPFCSKGDRDFGELTPLRIKGRKVFDLFDSPKESGIISSLKMAVLNAISSQIISTGKYNVIENQDPVKLIDLSSCKTITIVGAFQSYIRKISKTGNKLYVLEMSEEVLEADQIKLYVPAGEYRKVIPVSDIVIVTGQTLVNGTIDNILSVVSEGTRVIVTGPSASILPDVLFDNKVSIIGAVRITRPDVLFDIVSEGGTGFHLFEYCAQKISILKDDGA